ncbi:MAG: hypothetical protein ABSD76_18065 [Terriglobales bacterium]|jgi:hypothetical protein
MNDETIIGEARKRWLEFCEQAAQGHDPQMLIPLVKEINRVLQEEEESQQRTQSPSLSDAG